MAGVDRWMVMGDSPRGVLERMKPLLEHLCSNTSWQEVLERSNTCQKVVLEQVFQHCSNVGTETLATQGARADDIYRRPVASRPTGR